MTRAGDGIYTKVWDDGIYTKVGGVLWSSAFLVFVSPGWGGPGRSGWMQADSGFHVEHLAVASSDAKRCKIEILAGSLDGASEDYIRQNHMGETSTHVLYANNLYLTFTIQRGTIASTGTALSKCMCIYFFPGVCC